MEVTPRNTPHVTEAGPSPSLDTWIKPTRRECTTCVRHHVLQPPIGYRGLEDHNMA